MNIIVDNQKRIRQKSPKQIVPVLVFAFIICLAVFLMYLLNDNVIRIGLAIFTMITIILFIVRQSAKNLDFPFLVYSDGINLIIDNFEFNGIAFNGIKKNFPNEEYTAKQYIFELNQIVGYKIHNFFKKASFLEISLNQKGADAILNMRINIDSLNQKEANQLIGHLEGLLPHPLAKRTNLLN